MAGIPEPPGMEGIEPPTVTADDRVRTMMEKVGVLLEGELQGDASLFRQCAANFLHDSQCGTTLMTCMGLISPRAQRVATTSH